MKRRRGRGRWWSARVLVRCRCDDPADRGDLCEHAILLVRACNEAEAVRRAAAESRSHDHEYEGGTGYAVRWRFDRVLEVHELLDDELVDGVEVYPDMGRGAGRRRPEDPIEGWSAGRRLTREIRRAHRQP